MAKLFLIPTPIAKTEESSIFPSANREIIGNLRHFLVENIQNAISFLKWMNHPLPEYELFFEILDKRTKPESIHELMEPMRKGNDVGILTDAGMPGIADPGNLAVRWAHSNNHEVSTLIGPSSLFLALASSGLNGQNFHFIGYLPREESERNQRIKQLENESAQNGTTILFIEAPQRNSAVFTSLLENLNPESALSVAKNLTDSNQFLKTLTVENWQELEAPNLDSVPVIFLFQAVKTTQISFGKTKKRHSKKGRR